MQQAFDVIIVGAGAAGLMCAIEAGKRGRRVALLDHANRIGKKILISGGGRCNFTNLHSRAENFLSANPHFAKSALARYTPKDFITLVEKHSIPYHEKTLGQLFCDRSATDIVSMLEAECREAGVTIVLNAHIAEVSHEDGGSFRLQAPREDAPDATFIAPALVIATGGLSIPKMGATDFGYRIARQFGLAIRECRPALVPLVLSEEDQKLYCDRAGISASVIASCGKKSFSEKLLITHRGLSGPAILQISSYWKTGGTPGSRPGSTDEDTIEIDLAPGREIFAELLKTNTGRNLASARAALREILAHRLADRWLQLHMPEDWPSKTLIGTQELLTMEHGLHHWRLTPAGTEGYEKAEVTAGGVDTGELSAKTMESRKVPGLYFIGEVVDVTGQLGGFNFQWAWASGFCAGRALAGES